MSLVFAIMTMLAAAVATWCRLNLDFSLRGTLLTAAALLSIVCGGWHIANRLPVACAKTAWGHTMSTLDPAAAALSAGLSYTTANMLLPPPSALLWPLAPDTKAQLQPTVHQLLLQLLLSQTGRSPCPEAHDKAAQDRHTQRVSAQSVEETRYTLVCVPSEDTFQ
jgi:hypothetical protein